MIWRLYAYAKANAFYRNDGCAYLRIRGGTVWGLDIDHAHSRTKKLKRRDDEVAFGEEVYFVEEIDPEKMADALRRLGYAVHEPGTWAELTPAEAKS